jgi:Tannase and feruloyl esterase
MTKVAKSLVEAFYGRPARHSYFFGCSTGGQQALVEAQSFPEDYDGIIGGAPGNNRTHLLASFVKSYQTVHTDMPGVSVLSLEALHLLNTAVRKACAGQAGGLASDPFLNDPRECKFDPESAAVPRHQFGFDVPHQGAG